MMRISATVAALALASIAVLANSTHAADQTGNGSGTAAVATAAGTTNTAEPETSATSSVSPSSRLNEVVVTATKRRENVQDVPMSILPISGNQLAANQIFSVDQLSRAVPGFNDYYGAYQDARTTFSLRGVGTVSNGQLTQPSVGVVIDGVFIARSAAAMNMLSFGDIDHVEILRGPQGTLFGKNTTAGALNVVTRSPTQRPEGDVSVSYGSYNEIRAQGYVSGPLTNGDAVSGSMAFFAHHMDGYIHNILDNDYYDGSQSAGMRGKLQLKPRDGTRVLLSVDYENQRTTCCVAPIRYVNSQSPLADQGLYPGLPNPFPPGFVGPYNTQITGLDPLHRQTENRSDGLSVTLDQDLGAGYTLTSISAYRQWYATWDIPVGNLNDTIIPESFPTNTGIGNEYQASEEARIASPKGGFVDYVAGLFYYKDQIFQPETYGLDLASITGAPVGTEVDVGQWASHGGSIDYAAFIDANFHLTSALTLVAGARETRDKVFLNLHGTYIFGEPMLVDTSHTVTLPSWRFGPQYTISPNLMTYATVSHSFKGSAYDDKSTEPSGELAEPEVATSFEVGFKSTLLDNRLRANADAYLTNYKNFQAQGVVQNPQTLVLIEVLKNAGELRSQGVEMDLAAIPYRGVSLNLNAAYIHSYFASFPNAPCYGGEPIGPGECSGAGGFQNITGKPNALTPEFSYNADARYDLPADLLPFNPFVLVGYSWKSKVQWDILQDPHNIEGAYGLLNASIGARSSDGRISVTLYGTNLTNRFHTAGLEGAGQELPPDYKRLWGIRLDYQL
jgi:iron complex outermembrane receptor protein